MASSPRVFFDANVVVEIALEREKVYAAVGFLQKYAGESYVSVLTVHLAVHFGKKHASLQALQSLLSEFTTLALLPEDVTWAYENIRDEDFEDALQLAVAVRTGCDTFVTFDKQLAKTYLNLPTLKIKLLT